MISRRSFLIGINSLALAPQAFSMTSGQTGLPPVVSSGACDQVSEQLVPCAQRPAQFKVYGWNASHADESDPAITVIYLSNMWRSGWL